MASGTYNLNLLPHRFSIGRQGENRYRKVSFDVYKFVEPVFQDSADGVIFLIGVFRRPDGAIYNAIVEKIDRNDFDNVIDWYPTITETYYAGEGSLQFVISKMPVTGDTTVPEEYILGKSNVAQVTIEESSTESGPLPPTPDAPIQVTVTADVDAAWVNFAATKAITLATGDGKKTINLKVRDDVGNESAVVTKEIILDTAVPVVTITGPDKSKISKVETFNVAAISFTCDVDFVEYKVKVVPTTASLQDAGVVIGTTNGSTNMSGTGEYPDAQAIDCTINAADLEAASAGDGEKIIKVFVRNAAGTWSVA